MLELPTPAGPVLVGRSSEREAIDALLDRAASGAAQTLLISGAAGVGKTSLLESATTGRPGTTVAVGSGLPLVSVAVPFLAIRSAIASVDAAGTATDRIVTDGDESRVPGRFDIWLTGLCAAAPTTLVIDDLQWTDQATMDTLMFVIAGPADRRLSVLATVRPEGLGDGHPLQRWLATIRRLPRVTQLELGPLDRATTGEQLAALLGESPHQSLVEDVFQRSAGNPYLTRLIATGLPPDARRAPDTITSDLRSAVLYSWFQLAPRTRQVATALAIGGGPQRPAVLAAVLGEEEAAVREHLAAGVGAGALDACGDGTFWFPHPLNAEVLAHAVDADLRADWHAGFADQLEQLGGAGSADRASLIADHRYRAGDVAAAYRWAVQAAAGLERVGAHARAARMLRRAVNLRTQLAEAAESVDDLLFLWQRSAANAGAHELELEAVEELLGRTSPEASPLVVADLLVRRMHLRFSTGRAFITQEGPREAARLAAAVPTSPQYALALAELAHADLWQDDPDAAAHATHALRVARAAGDDRALSFALTANAMAAVFVGDGTAGRRLAREALAAGVRAKEWWGCVHAVLWESNTTEAWVGREVALVLGRRREELAAAGAPHAYIAWLAAAEADSWMTSGVWQECAARLRETLVSDPGQLADVAARLTAARLATWQGRQAEAEQHLARADELFAEGSAFLAFQFDAVRAEVRLGAGDATGAHRAALAGTEVPGTTPTRSEWLIPLAARALADIAQVDRDAGADPARVLALVDDLELRFPEVIRDVGELTPAYLQQLSALQAWYLAELGRARCLPDEGDRWALAIEQLGAADLPWEEAYALRRAADAVLSHGADRARGASLLRRGLVLAEQLQARPLVQELLALARRSRVPTSLPPVVGTSATADRLGVTAREREILSLLVAGRTYAEIARELVISEKTVSSHVSNLLAKTGTSNRVELAGFAVRTGVSPGP